MAAPPPVTDSAAPVAVAAGPPRPDECDHPHPVVGVMAHEFSTYQGAIGPEGTRRTSTYYGPVIGGLPISAWHCETCGLLRLSFIDGRTEERRLYPGTQPGLLSVATPFDPDSTAFGMQARVSGITVPPSMYRELIAPYEAPPAAPPWAGLELPAWGPLTWMTVAGLGVVMAGLLIIGILAVYTYSTPDSVGPIAAITALTFGAVVLMQLGGAAQRQWFPFPSLPPSIAVSQRSAPSLDGATVAVVTLLSLTMVGLFVAAILAVYTYSTSPAEGPVIAVTVVFAVAAILIALGSAAARRARGR